MPTGISSSALAHTGTEAGTSARAIEPAAIGGVSEEIRDSLAAALQLDDVERAHLAALIRAANAPHRPADRDGGTHTYGTVSSRSSTP
ncbi:hypothetical protein PS467_14075 [Streptomyces luomodiensis]|uniref:Uncharacterized protein n=1 Tax=Streptomyces luomodiensis TaxID=3026192 RepID=A0ABY9V0Z1_9ACTN|nr:hypothetical protein [Streptomyces sp. SCA4-21]WNE96385.1 hypothetical protein PS467_14075 [Streptomyces sp. SCA4-21]